MACKEREALMPEEDNGATPEQQSNPQPGMQMQIGPGGVVLTFPCTLAMDNETATQFVRNFLQTHPELREELVREMIAQKQQELAIIQMMRKSRID
jgi:hypothetical protein